MITLAAAILASLVIYAIGVLVGYHLGKPKKEMIK